MNILLIAPAAGNWRKIARRRFFNGKTFRFSMLSLLSVAAISPKNAKITIVDEQAEDIPEGSFDLVGITAMTAVAPRAYALCDQFRSRGIPVVMGGYHASLNTEEALAHADAVVSGPAYGAWEKVCADVQAGRPLERIYTGDPAATPPVHLPRHLIAKEQYVTVSATFATLGCTNHCQFCSINRFHGGQRHTRPVADMASELTGMPDGFFVFVDDNLTQDRPYALALFKALETAGKRWITQVSIDIAEDGELLSAMRAAGCMGVFVGLETFNEENLHAQDKDFNKPAHYRDAIAKFHAHGLYVEAGVIVGFDADHRGVFRNTLRMLDWIRIDAIQLAILTPLPGTALYEAMEPRIIDRDWEHYDFRHAVFEPKHMSAAELQAGADWIIRRFYSPWRILKRIPRWAAIPRGLFHFPHILALNLAYFGRVRRFHIGGHDPAKQVIDAGQRAGKKNLRAAHS